MFKTISESDTLVMVNNKFLKIRDFIKEIKSSYSMTYQRLANPGDDLLNDDEKLLLSNPDDKKKYLEAIKKLTRKREEGLGDIEESITLSNGKEIIISTIS